MDLFNTKPGQEANKKISPKLILGIILAATLVIWILRLGAISNISRQLFWITAAVFFLYNIYSFVKKLSPAFSK